MTSIICAHITTMAHSLETEHLEETWTLMAVDFDKVGFRHHRELWVGI